MLSRLFRRPNPNQALMPLYQAVIAQGRQPHWYLDGAVPDTLDGRFRSEEHTSELQSH